MTATPLAQGFAAATADYSGLFEDNDSDCFQLGGCNPGGNVANYNAWWHNLGTCYLYALELSLVAHPTADSGLPVDTTDVMKIGPDSTHLLGFGVPANSGNTSGWTYPIPEPMLPFLNPFKAGVRWYPPLGAGVGIIRKAFQVTAGYMTDTWDALYHPIGNLVLPTDVGDILYPYVEIAGTPPVDKDVVVDATTATGYAVRAQDIGGTTCAYFQWKHLGTEPWPTSVNNATGYVIEARIKFDNTYKNNSFQILAHDGAYETNVTLKPNGTTGLFLDRVVTPTQYYFDPCAPLQYHTVRIQVQGTAIEVFLNGVSRLTGVLNYADTGKDLSFATYTISGNFRFYFEHLKYYLGGPAVPVG